LLPETTTPEMLMAKLAGQKPSNYEQLLPGEKKLEDQGIRFAGQHGVRIYEPYNIQTNAPETNIFQRLIWQEHRNPTFISERQKFAHIVKDHHEYMALFA
jgi:hypothetical protein